MQSTAQDYFPLTRHESQSGLFKSRNSCGLRLYSGGSLMTDPFKTDRLTILTNRKAKEVVLHIFLLLTVEVYIFSMQTLNIMVSVNFLVFYYKHLLSISYIVQLPQQVPRLCFFIFIKYFSRKSNNILLELSRQSTTKNRNSFDTELLLLLLQQ